MKNEAVSAAQKRPRDKEKNVLDLGLLEDGKSLYQMWEKW